MTPETPAHAGVSQASAADDARTGWHKPRPAHLPAPTYWPAVLAFGIVLLLWGLVTSPILFGTGLVIFALGLGGWIRELLREEPYEEPKDI